MLLLAEWHLAPLGMSHDGRVLCAMTVGSVCKCKRKAKEVCKKKGGAAEGATCSTKPDFEGPSEETYISFYLIAVRCPFCCGPV